MEETTNTSKSECLGFKGEQDGGGGLWPSSLLFPAPSYFTPYCFQFGIKGVLSDFGLCFSCKSAFYLLTILCVSVS